MLDPETAAQAIRRELRREKIGQREPLNQAFESGSAFGLIIVGVPRTHDRGRSVDHSTVVGRDRTGPGVCGARLYHCADGARR